MADAELVRTSRDGDQFHYLRGARLCLELLQPGTTLVAVTVEGVSTDEELAAGLNVIDLALYRGSTDPAQASVRYRQFKHSTLQADDEWTASGLVKTLAGFGARYAGLVAQYGEEDVAERFRFDFETNRPIASDVVGALDDLAKGIESGRSGYMRSKIGLTGDALSNFAALVSLMPSAPDFLSQRSLLQEGFSAYLVDRDKDAPLQLKELVTQKATSEFAHNPQITRHDVLSALDVREGDLFPRPCLIDLPAVVVARDQLPDLAAGIRDASMPVILQADGGVGKSVTATTLAAALPEGTKGFVYDCFGNGGYRSASEYRHRPRDGLVQLANEMASAGLCDPLIPTPRADDAAFVRAFMGRVRQASSMLAKAGDGLLLLVIDAADNAEAAASEAGDGPSFPRLLLRETWPGNVRLVLTARPHRVEDLTPPPGILVLTLKPFSEAETARQLRARFPAASAADVREFHRLTSHNPRVQSAALAAGDSIEEVLAALGPTPRTVEDTINNLLEQAVARARDVAGSTERTQIDQVCVALATLRPFVPLAVVAATAEVSVELVRSLANDLQRPLIVREDAVQFRDEPTETWFRQRFRPTGPQLAAFVARLRPLAGTSAYVAAVLPQLMLEAGQFDELVTLALNSEALPQGSPMARRDVELQRLQFALKAALRSKRYPDAAKLAMKAGGEAAADERQQTMLTRNTDLAARFLEPNQLVELVSRRQISAGGWTGSEHAYEAAILSGHSSLAGDARSRLRFAYEWLSHWLHSRRDTDGGPSALQDEDIAELQLAELNLHGARICARQLRRWTPREISFRVGRLIVARLIDAGRLTEIDVLAIAARNDLGLILAVTMELAAIGRLPPREAVRRATALLRDRRVLVNAPGDWRGEEVRVLAIASLVAAAARLRIAPRAVLARILDRYLPKEPPRGLATRFPFEHDRRLAYLRAYSLRAGLRRRPVRIEALAERSLRKAVKAKQSYHQEADRFVHDIGALLPWHAAWVDAELGRIDRADVAGLLERTLDESRKAEGNSYREVSSTADEIARLWSQILVRVDAPEPAWDAFGNWRKKLDRPLFIPTLTSIARLVAETGRKSLALDFAAEAYRLAEAEREDAESKADGLIAICRAVLTSSEAEAREYFNQAVLVASRIGTENLSRWDAMVHLATACAQAGFDDPATAYRFARGAELTYHHVARDKHFDWEESIGALVGLSPRSAPAILSRWGDRRFGRRARIVPALIAELGSRGLLNPLTALAFLPMPSWWDLPDLLTPALAGEDTKEGREHVAAIFWRYARFMQAGASTLRQVQETLQRYDIVGVNVDAAILAADRAEADPAKNEQKPEWNSKEPEIDWALIFDGLDLGQPEGFAEARQRYRNLKRGYYAEQFFSAAFERIGPGAEGDFLRALAGSGTIGLYELRGLLDALPPSWRSRLSVGAALDALVTSVYRSECFSISATRHYQTVSPEFASQHCGLSKEQLIAEVVDAIGLSTVPSAAGNLFRLAGLLAILLNAQQAHDALGYALQLLEPLHDPTDGDGPWSDALMPPATLEGSLAGYLWAALGAIETARRWNAAHCVRTLAMLGRAEMLEHLLDFARTRTSGVFTDAQLRFYDLHALQWLVIGLARAAIESGPVVAPHVAFLREQASRSNRHVLVRKFAAEALMAMHDNGSHKLDDAELATLRAINKSSLPVVNSRAYSRARDGKAVKRARQDQRFHFGLDFPKNFLSPLGRAFAMSDAEMELAAEAIIRDDWGLDDDGRWKHDVRATRKYFRDDVGRGRGDIGKADDLAFYLSYHATMTLAGKLLEERPLHEDLENPEDDWSTFRRWLRDEALTRQDGLWLADRRDPVPADCLSLPEIADEQWTSSLTDDVVERLVTVPDRGIVISGHWTIRSGRREQRVTVNSALATSARAGALARALQTARDPQDWALPRYGADDDIEAGDYVLRGWISEVGQESGLDTYDHWAANLSTRMLEPADAFLADLALAADRPRRVWCSMGTALLWSEAWSEADSESESGDRGKRLIASRMVLDRLMVDGGYSLIVEIWAERRLEVPDYERRERRERRDAQTITRILLIEAGRDPVSFRCDPRPRQEARRRARPRKQR